MIHGPSSAPKRATVVRIRQYDVISGQQYSFLYTNRTVDPNPEWAADWDEKFRLLLHRYSHTIQRRFTFQENDLPKLLKIFRYLPLHQREPVTVLFHSFDDEKIVDALKQTLLEIRDIGPAFSIVHPSKVETYLVALGIQAASSDDATDFLVNGAEPGFWAASKEMDIPLIIRQKRRTSSQFLAETSLKGLAWSGRPAVEDYFLAIREGSVLDEAFVEEIAPQLLKDVYILRQVQQLSALAVWEMKPDILGFKAYRDWIENEGQDWSNWYAETSEKTGSKKHSPMRK